MDTNTFYGRKEGDRAVRVIPSDSEDSALEENDSEEEWTPETGLRSSLRNRLGVGQGTVSCVVFLRTRACLSKCL